MSTIVSDLVSHLQCGEAISANDAVYIDSATGKIFKFDPTDDTQTFAGLAKEAGVLNDFIRVSQSGRIKGFSGLTPGAFVYASVTVPGSFQLVEPAPSQKVILGIAKSATELIINGGLGIKPGGDGSGGGLDVYYAENMEGLANVSDFATGNNATFLGGGTLQGVLAVEDVAPISGLKSLKYTQAAGSLNDYFASEIIDIDLKQQNNTSGMTLYFEYDGNDNDMCFVVWDVTNNQRLSSEVTFVKKTGKAQRYSLSFYVPTSCTQIRVGAQVLVENIGAILVVDDIQLTSDTTVYADTIQTHTVFAGSGSVTGNGQVTNFSLISDSHGGVLKVNSGTGVTAVKPCVVDVFMYWQAAASQTPSGILYLNGSVYVGLGRSPTALNTSSSVSIPMKAGDTLTFYIDTSAGVTNTITYSVTATASNPSIITPVDQVSSDTIPFRYRSSAQVAGLAALANAQIGDYITFTFAASGGTVAQTTGTNRPAQTDADMNVNGVRLYTRAYNASSTAANPAYMAIQIGKGYKGYEVTAFKDTAKSFSSPLDLFNTGSSTEYGARFKDYNPETGVLIIDLATTLTSSVTNKIIMFTDGTTQTNGYVTFSASKASLVGLPVPQVAYLKDVKPSGTSGGTFTAGAWQTRTLNTLEGDSQIVSLSGNQFTLPAGKYEIEASAPAYRVGVHKIKLRDITDSSDSVVGTSEFARDDTGQNQTRSNLIGTLILASTKTFELQHRGGVTHSGDGFGVSSGFGINEIYTQVKITRIG